MTVADQIKYMLRLGWSRERLAARLNCTVDSVENWEAGRFRPHAAYRVVLFRMVTR